MPSLAVDAALAYRWASGFPAAGGWREGVGLFAANALLLKTPGVVVHWTRRWLAARSWVRVGSRSATYRRRKLAMSEWATNDDCYVEYRVERPERVETGRGGAVKVYGETAVARYDSDGETPCDPDWRPWRPAAVRSFRIPPYFQGMEEIRERLAELAAKGRGASVGGGDPDE